MHDKIVLLAKIKLNSLEVLISKVLIDSNNNHEEFISVNKALREYNETNQETKIPETFVIYTL